METIPKLDLPDDPHFWEDCVRNIKKVDAIEILSEEIRYELNNDGSNHYGYCINTSIEFNGSNYDKTGYTGRYLKSGLIIAFLRKEMFCFKNLPSFEFKDEIKKFEDSYICEPDRFNSLVLHLHN